jgi:hypothetical protein
MTHHYIGLPAVLVGMLSILTTTHAVYAGVRQDRADVSYTLQVDYDPRTGMLAGQCKVNGRPCWLVLDTGSTGLILFQERRSEWEAAEPPSRPTAGAPEKAEASRVELAIAPSSSLTSEVAAKVRSSPQSWQTTEGQPIVGVLGAPFITDPDVEWNIPARKVTFWLRGLPEPFQAEHRQTVVSMRCSRDRSHRIFLPVSVQGNKGHVLFDTGSYDLYLPDTMLRDFPSVGAVEEEAPLGTPMSVVRRRVRGVRIGPMDLSGVVRSIVAGAGGAASPPDYGYLGDRILSLYHLFVRGDTVWIAKN